MPVQQHVLNWLYSILTSEYHDVNRTYSHVAQALTQCPTLSPRTDVHTFPDGSSALLLHLTGTIPVNFRGNTYRFPVSIWIPHAYPREPPLVYVTPAENMLVRPGQHVDPQGQVYHPYLVGWAQFWDKSNIQDFLSVLADVFAKEPPVVARQVDRQAPRHELPTPPPLPPPPPDVTARSAQTPPRATIPSGPPPPPPKEHRGAPSSQLASQSTSRTENTGAAAAAARYDSAPPLPPEAHHSPSQDRHRQSLPPPSHYPQRQNHQFSTSQSHISHVEPPSGPHGLPAHHTSFPSPSVTPPHVRHWMGQNQTHNQQPPPGYAAYSQGTHPSFNGQPMPFAAPAPPPPPPNILDEPLTLDIPASTTVAPPPIPPNPEKNNLLGQLAHTLHAIRQRTRQQNDSSMTGLQAQRTAMQQAMAGINSESSQLTQLSNLLTSNTNILHEALRKADTVIEGSRRHPAPDMDELLVAPTVVSNQLYHLVAEERALGDAIFVLGRAVERGRVSPAVFAKTTRSLAREWYLKKAVVRKIGRGMGMIMA